MISPHALTPTFPVNVITFSYLSHWCMKYIFRYFVIWQLLQVSRKRIHPCFCPLDLLVTFSSANIKICENQDKHAKQSVYWCQHGLSLVTWFIFQTWYSLQLGRTHKQTYLATHGNLWVRKGGRLEKWENGTEKVEVFCKRPKKEKNISNNPSMFCSSVHTERCVTLSHPGWL